MLIVTTWAQRVRARRERWWVVVLAGLAVLALAMGGFAIGTTEFVTMGLLPQIAEGVDVSIPSAGQVISAYALGVVVGAPLIAVFGGLFASADGAFAQLADSALPEPPDLGALPAAA